MRVAVLSRGGLAVYGGHYDPHANEAVILIRDGETAALTIEYPSAPTAPTTAQSGVSCTTPTISGNKIAATLSSAQDGGYADLTATVAGEQRTVRVRARTRTPLDRYDLGGELI